MEKFQIYLINPSDPTHYGVPMPVNGPTGLLWIQQSLREKGIKSRIYPNSKYYGSLDELVGQIINISLKGKAIVWVGFSCTDLALDKVFDITRNIRRSRAPITIFGGGPSFDDPEQNRAYLEAGYFDAVIKGHAAPFVHAAESVANGSFVPSRGEFLFKGFNAQPGFYALDSNGMFGAGEGAVPQLETVPLSYSYPTKNSMQVVVVTPGKCPNACHYCKSTNIPYLGTSKTLAALTKLIGSRKNRERQFSLTLEGNSALSPTSIRTTQKILEQITRRKTYVAAASYLDPSDLLDKDHFDRVYNLALMHRVRNLNFGLDASTWLTSQGIGRNFRREPRKRWRLDQEVNKAIELINEVTRGIGDSTSLETTFYYILSPFDNKNTVGVALDNLYKIGTKTLHTLHVPSISYFPLWPLTGTKIREDRRDMHNNPPPYLTWNWNESALKQDTLFALLPFCKELAIPSEILTKTELYFMTLAAMYYCLNIDEPNLDIGLKYIPDDGKGIIRSDVIKETYLKFANLIPSRRKDPQFIFKAVHTTFNAVLSGFDGDTIFNLIHHPPDTR